ncbi:MAG: threonine--tRNA ligase [Candidatus Margulisbacteria bacterium]|nr:threonine--tRNA ligase [Candidatus Margulisiibacteriota bacterium]
MNDLSALRHTASHILAQAVLRLYPDAKLGIGPAIDDGFYYDFDLSVNLVPEDLLKIEAEVKKIVKENLPLIKKVLPRDKALTLLKEKKQPYKIELVKELPENEEISFYEQGEFVDLCRGPHVAATGIVKAIKLLRISGAYWRGKETNPMLQRIYGIAFENETELTAYMKFLEEAEKRDHRKLGKELDLFSTQEKAGPGLIYWHPKGARIRHVIESFWKEEHFNHGYELIYSPHIGQSWLWETSGHLGFYKENMFAPMQLDEQDYFVKPMNCPFHILVYKSSLRSYRDLPLRWAELGTVYRYERSGVLHGLLRVRGFTQDDAHIFCTPEQMESEILEVIRFSIYIWKTLGFTDLNFYLSTKPEGSVGDPTEWREAEKALRNALEKENITNYKVDEGGGAFYGPKIDIKIKDALKREWQVSTIQFDFNMPKRFDMTYIGADGNRHQPYMIHRALLGSLERFFGILIEHYMGKFPFWLAPVQFKTLCITNHEETLVFAMHINEQLKLKGFRGAIDDRNEKLGLKIREAQLEQIPYMIIIGDNEAKQNKVSLRKHGESATTIYSIEEVINLFADLTNKKA